MSRTLRLIALAVAGLVLLASSAAPAQEAPAACGETDAAAIDRIAAALGLIHPDDPAAGHACLLRNDNGEVCSEIVVDCGAAVIELAPPPPTYESDPIEGPPLV